MRKILVIGQSDNPGGVETVIKRYYEAVKDDIKFDFLASTPTCYDQQFYEKSGCKIYTVKNPQFRHPIKYKNEIKHFFEGKKGEYSAIWMNCCDLANVGVIIKEAKRIGIHKRIVHAHNTQLIHTGKKRYFYKLMHGYWKKNISQYATDYWACSIAAGKFFFEDCIIDSDKFKIINNAIETAKYAYNDSIRVNLRKKFDIKDDEILIGHVGRFQYQKNHEFLIDLFADYYKKNSNSILMLIGIGKDELLIKQKVKSLGLEKCVWFMEARNDVNELMQAMDVFLLPSRFEGLPLVLIEAQTAGLPCVTSKDVVPYEVNVTDNVAFVGLDEPIDTWVGVIERQLEKAIDRNQCSGQVTLAGYNIKEEAERFKQFMEA